MTFIFTKSSVIIKDTNKERSNHINSFKRLNLEFANGQKIRYNEAYLEKFCTELVELLSGEDYMRKISFAKRMMMSQELKSNNTIEGINDDLTRIDEVIKKKSSLSEHERKRIINLYQVINMS